MTQKPQSLLGRIDPKIVPSTEFDIATLLALQKRELFLQSDMDELVCSELAVMMRYLDAISDEPITLFVNSAGGQIYEGLALINVMRSLRSPIRTVCIGYAMSMATYVLAAGTKGQRFACRWARLMIHQPADYLHGRETKDDTKVRAKELDILTKMGIEMYGTFGSARADTYASLLEGIDKYMTPDEFMKLGLIDGVIDTLNT